MVFLGLRLELIREDGPQPFPDRLHQQVRPLTDDQLRQLETDKRADATAELVDDASGGGDT